MKQTIQKTGRLVSPKTVELDEPAEKVNRQVQVLLNPLPSDTCPAGEPGAPRDVFDFLASLGPGNRTKADIAQQITEERDWGRIDQQ